jgi:arginine/lysine/ornithine decarboxylase
VIDGLVLSGLRPSFVAPELDPELGIAHCLTPASLAEALEATPDAVAAIVLSPTYFGACADIAGLAEVAHERGLPLVVDEAWGAHLRFHPELPPDAVSSGADAVICSVHKIVGSLTQSAILHLAGERLDENVLDRCVSVTESTSPSSLLSGSLDAARRLAAVKGEERLSETIEALRLMRGQIGEISGLDVLDERMVGRAGVAAWDPLRLAIDVRGTGSTGYRLAGLTHEIGDVNFELFAENVVVAAFSLGAPAAPDGERLVAVLRQAAEQLGGETAEAGRAFAPPPPWGELVLTPREAFLGPQEVIRFERAAGRISAESLAAYPPGIPNVLPGERLTSETLQYIAEGVALGGFVRGATDRELHTLRVSREDRR